MYSVWEELHERMRKQYSDEQEVERMISTNVLEVLMPPVIIMEESPEIVFRVPRVIRMRILNWKTIPEVEYKIPILVTEQEPQRERGWLGGLIEGEGSFFETREVMREYVRRRPGFLIRMKEKPPIARAGKDLGITPHPHPRPPAPPAYWVISTAGSPAISIAHWSLQELTPNSKRAEDARKLLKTYKHHYAVYQII